MATSCSLAGPSTCLCVLDVNTAQTQSSSNIHCNGRLEIIEPTLRFSLSDVQDYPGSHNAVFSVVNQGHFSKG